MPPSNAVSEIHSGTGSQRSRRRRHTACIRCREQRIKCRGGNPCASCIQSTNTCVFSDLSGRVSHVAEGVGIHQHGSTSIDEVDPDEESAIRESPPMDDEVLDQQKISRFALGQHEIDTSTSLDEQVSDMGLEQPHTLNSATATPPDQLTSPRNIADSNTLFNPNMVCTRYWPWLHETLYLPPNQENFLNFMGPSSPIDSVGYVDSGTFTLIDSTQYQPGQSDTPQSQKQRSELHKDPSSGTAGAENPFYGIPAVTSSLKASNDNGAALASRNRPEQSSSAQLRVVNDLIGHATAPSNLGDQSSDDSYLWTTVSPRVADAFQIIPPTDVSRSSLLYHLVDLYFKYFGQLWPMISPQNMELDTLHPLLFLVLASIGSMYGDSTTSNFGTVLHNNIRPYLTVALELDDGENDFIWLAQARLLTQVAALYFGRPKAFSYAQHLGALLIAQARRMDLFSAEINDKWMANFSIADDQVPDEERLAIWLHLEARRRLAFGIFRAETYTSVLLHTKPLISMEEIDLKLPMCDAVWLAKKMPTQVCLHLIQQDRTPGRHLWASDIFRIAMDREESLPLLDSGGFELLQFGLQWPLWRLARDPNMLERLTGQRDGPCPPESGDSCVSVPNPPLSDLPLSTIFLPNDTSRLSTLSEADRLESTSRRMQDLRYAFARLLSALQKLEQALPSVKSFVHTERDRTSLMSGLISHHLAFMRLHAPIGDLHQIQYCLADGRGLDYSLVESVRKWANSHQARLAAERATTIESLIVGASQKHGDQRLKFNLLAFTGLHHSAIVLWVYANAREHVENIREPEQPMMLQGLDPSSTPILVNRADSARMMASFVRLYDLITPAKWSSFAQAADALSMQEFPGRNQSLSTLNH